MGGLYGLISVILGAYAAHSLRDVISSESLSSWQTGVFYQMSHALVLLFTGLWLQLGGPRVLVFAGAFFSAGVLGFSGSIYLLVLTQMSWLGPVTPLGGLSLIAGWVFLSVAVLRVKGFAPGREP